MAIRALNLSSEKDAAASTTKKPETKPKVQHSHDEPKPEVPTDRVVFYVKEATPFNAIKPLMLIEALNLPHHVQVVPSPKKDTWFHEVNPQGLIPAIEGVELRNGKRLEVFESTSCLYYLVDCYDWEGAWGGKDLWERTQVRNWVQMHAAGLGPAGNNWFTWRKNTSKNLKDAIALFADEIRDQYKILDDRLSKSGQKFIGLPDRETIADLVNLPFCNAQAAEMIGIDLDEFPKLKEWGVKMMEMEPVKKAFERIMKFKLDEDEEEVVEEEKKKA